MITRLFTFAVERNSALSHGGGAGTVTILLEHNIPVVQIGDRDSFPAALQGVVFDVNVIGLD